MLWTSWNCRWHRIYLYLATIKVIGSYGKLTHQMCFSVFTLVVSATRSYCCMFFQYIWWSSFICILLTACKETFILIFSFLNSSEIDLPYFQTEITTESSPLTLALARHLHSAGAKMYGAFWCSHCIEQKQVLPFLQFFLSKLHIGGKTLVVAKW